MPETHAGTEPLRAFRSFASNDLDAARAYVGRVFKPHALRAGRDYGNARVTVNHHGAGPWSVVSFGYGGASVEVDPGALERFYLLQFALRGRSAMRYGSTNVVIDTTSAACLSPQRGMRGHFQAGTHMLVVRLDKTLVEDFFGFEQSAALGPLEFDPHVDLRRAPGQRLVNAVKRLVGRVEAGDTAEAEELADIVTATLCAQQPNSWQRYERTTGASQAERIVRRVEAYMHDHIAADLDVARLAESAGVSPREMFVAFRAHGKSPMAYLRDVRIRRAHHELTSRESASVTDIALGCGFTHLGRFSALYRQQYGCAPSAALRGRPV